MKKVESRRRKKSWPSRNVAAWVSYEREDGDARGEGERTR